MFTDSGVQTQVNVTSGLEELLAQIVTGPAGTFAVYTSVATPSAKPGALILRQLDATGTPTGAEMTLTLPASSYAGTGSIQNIRLVALSTGAFAVAYTDQDPSATPGNPPASSAARVQLYTSAGGADGAPVTASSSSGGTVTDFAFVAANPTGGVDLSYHTYGPSTATSAVVSVSGAGSVGSPTPSTVGVHAPVIAYSGSARILGNFPPTFPNPSFVIDFPGSAVDPSLSLAPPSTGNTYLFPSYVMRAVSATVAVAAIEILEQTSAFAPVKRTMIIARFTDGQPSAQTLTTMTLPTGFAGSEALQDFVVLADGSFALALSTYAAANAPPTSELRHYSSTGALIGAPEVLNPGGSAAGGVQLSQLADGRLVATYSGVTAATGGDMEVFRELFTVTTPGASNDSLVGGGGNDNFAGLDGNDTLVGNAGGDTLDGGAGSDFIDPGANAAGPNGSAPADLIVASLGNDTITFAEADSLSGYTLDYRTLNAPITLSITGATGTVAKAGAGTDTLIGLDRIDTNAGILILGSGQADSVTVDVTAALNAGTLGNFYQFRLGAGNDTLTRVGSNGFVRADYRDASHAIDVNLNLASGQVVRDGFGGTDTLVNVNEVSGSNNSDRLIGNAADNMFIANAGDHDIVDGGGGFDRLRYDRVQNSIAHVDLESGFAASLWQLGSGPTGSVTSIRNVEWVRGSSGSETLVSNATGATRFEGRGGDDTFVYRGGALEITDFIGGTGISDRLIIDPGQFSNAATAVAARAQVGANVVITFGAGNTITLLDRTLAQLDDDDFVTSAIVGQTVTGDNANNIIFTHLGDDTISGGAGDDTLFGGAGNDSILGGTGGDFISGGLGNDYLNPGSNTNTNGIEDSIIAGLGNDTIDFADAGAGFFVVDYRGQTGSITANLNGAAGYTVTKNGAPAGANTDTLANFNTIDGTTGGIEIIGTSGVDTFNLSSNDTDGFISARGNEGADRFNLNANPGDFYAARLEYRYATSGITATLSGTTGGTITDGLGFTDTVTIAAAGLIAGFGTGQTARLEISASNYADSLRGGALDDRFILYSGNDTVDGGAGFDRIRYDRDGGATNLVVNLAAGFATGSWSNVPQNSQFAIAEPGFLHTIASIEWVRGSNNADRLTGNATGVTRLEGRGGGDRFTYVGGATEITDFEGAGAAVVDFIQVQGVAGFPALMALRTSADGDTGTTFTFSAGNTLRLNNVAYTALTAGDFIFGNAAGPVTNVATPRNDTVTGDDANDNLSGGDGDDVLFGQGGGDTINGGNGNDLINPGANNSQSGFLDVIIGGSGNDTVSFAQADSFSEYQLNYSGLGNGIAFTANGATGTVAKGALGTDTLTSLDRISDNWGLFVRGTVHADTFNLAPNTGALGSFYGINPGGGNDTITRSSANGFVSVDYRDASSGIYANLSLATGQVVRDGFGGTDTLVGFNEVNGANISEVRATNFNDTVIGSGSNDRFIMNSGFVDVLDGGAGFDRIRYDRGGVSSANVDLEGGIATSNWSGFTSTTALRNIEHVRGTFFNDLLIGNASGQTLFEGRGGNDAFVYRGGQMTITDFSGGPGVNDSLVIDPAQFANAATAVGARAQVGANVVITLSAGNTITLLNTTLAQLSGDDFVTTAASAQTVTGDATNNVINGLTNGGLAGNDTLSGGLGNDTINGGSGNDSILGGDGADVIHGGVGNDYLNPGNNPNGTSDIILGSAGNDTIDFTGVSNGSFYELDYRTVAGSITANILASTSTSTVVKNASATGTDTITGFNDIDGSGATGGFSLVGTLGADTFNIATDDTNAFVGLRGGEGADVFNLNANPGGDYGVRLEYRYAPNGIVANLAGNVAGTSGTIVDGTGSTDTITIAAAGLTAGAGTGQTARLEISATNFDDSLLGGALDDRFILYAGNDTVDGGAGFDRIRYDRGGAVTGLTVDLDRGFASGAWANGYGLSGASTSFFHTISNIEWVRASTNDDLLIGRTSGQTRFELRSGATGNDTIVYQGGQLQVDNFTGGAGLSDRLQINMPGVTSLATMPTAQTAGGDTIYDFGGGNTLTLKGVTTALAADDFLFGPTTGGTVNITGDAAGERLDGTSGNDSILGNGGNDTINGFAGNDTLRGGDGNDSLVGGEGDDGFWGGTGVDTYVGGAGAGDGVNADMQNGGQNVVINLSTAIQTYKDVYGNNETMTGIEGGSGTNQADVFTGSSTYDAATRSGVDNYFNAYSGADTVNGGLGFDLLNVTNSDGLLTQLNAADQGAGVIANFAIGRVTLASGTQITMSGIERVRGTGLQDVFIGGGLDGGGNQIYASFRGIGGSDTYVASAGIEQLDFTGGGSGAVTVNLSTGAYGAVAANSVIDSFGNVETIDRTNGEIDDVRGANAADLIVGNALDNSFQGLDGNDTLVGLDGDDTLSGGRGADSFVGGAGSDWVSNHRDVFYDLATSGVTVNLATQTQIDAFGNTDSLDSIENAGGTELADSLTGDAGDNIFRGYGGADTIDGGLGVDEVQAYGPGVFRPSAGDQDFFQRGTRGMVVNFSSSGVADTAQGGTPATIVAAGRVVDQFGALDQVSNVENARGTMFGDVFAGSSSVANVFTGLDGADRFIDNGGGVRVNYGDDQAFGGLSGVLVNLTTGALTLGGVSIAAGTARDGFGKTDTLIGVSAISGTGFADIVVGGTAANSLAGGLGDDNLTGGTSNDTLDGGGGADVLNGGAGSDLMTGGDGNDIFVVDNLSDQTIELANEGIDTARVSTTSHTLAANVENLVFTGTGGFTGTGNALANSITLGAGNDSIEGLEGADTIAAGLGLDQVSYANSDAAVSITLNGAAAASASGGHAAGDVLTGFEGIDGSAFDDTLTGDANANWLAGLGGADSLSGGAGNDTLDGGTGADTMVGGANDDVYLVDDAGDVVAELAGGGTDTIDTSLTTYTLGEDVENLRALAGSSAAFTLTGNALANVIVGASGDDSLSGDAGADTLQGGLGADTLNGGAGADSMVGGAGDDSYVVDSLSDIVVEAAGAGDDSVTTTLAAYSLNPVSANLGLLQVERLAYVGSAAFAGTGNALNNVIAGDGGNDTLLGLAGADTLSGNGGQDSLDGGLGADSMDGGTDSDTYVVDSVGDVVIEAVGGGVDTVRTTLSSYTLSAVQEIENLTATGTAAFSGTGNALENVIIGAGANDTLSGLGGADTLIGGAGADSLDGGAGNDRLDGGAGADVMVGGADDDTYVVDATTDVVTEVAGGGADTVLTALGALTLAAEVESLTFTGTGTAGFAGTGNALANIITGGGGNDILLGAAGNDSLLGAAGADVLNGGDDDDTLIGGAGNDTLDGGTGAGDVAKFSGALADYTISFVPGGTSSEVFIQGNGSASSDGTDRLANVETLSFADGDVLLSSLLGVNITGTAGADTITTASGTFQSTALNDRIDGGAGNDTIEGGAGTDVLIGGLGVDTLSYASSSAGVTVTITDGAQTVGVGGDAQGDQITGFENVVGSNNADSLTGSATANALSGGDGVDTLVGGAGNDTLDGGVGSDSMSGGLNNDVYVVDELGDVVVELAGGGLDRVRAQVTGVILAAEVEELEWVGTGAFAGTGNALGNRIIGGTADDTLDGAAGADTMTGLDGNDTYVVDNAGDVVTEAAGAGTDSVQTSLAGYTLGANIEDLIYTGSAAFTGIGNALDNTIDAATGSGVGSLNDSLSGGLGNDTLRGFSGADTLNGGAGDDLMTGGADNDTYIVDSAGDLVNEVFGGGTDSVLTSLTSLTLSADVENLSYTGTAAFAGTGNAENNVVTGAGANDTLSGLGGADTLIGGAGADQLIGGAGNDRLDGGAGADIMTGGADDDTYVVDAATDVVTELAGEGTDTVVTTLAALTLAANVENLTFAGATAFTGTGNSENNVITGGAANDTLSGATGNDSLVGGAGADVLNGGADDDTLVGGAGNDTLDGGLGVNAAQFTGAYAGYNIAFVTGGIRVTDLTAGRDGVDTIFVSGSSAITSLIFSDQTVLVADILGTNTQGTTLADNFVGGEDVDRYDGLAGNDTVEGGAAGDELIGGAGVDTLSYAGSQAAVNVALVTGAAAIASGGDAAGDIASGFESLLGSSFDDTLAGDTGANLLDGGDGDDSLFGNAGIDSLLGGFGNDTVRGGAGADVLNGGDGFDAASYESASAGITASLALSGTNTGEAAGDSYVSIEDLIGSSFADTLTGNNLANVIIGGAGADSLAGNAGDDTLSGGNDADQLVGGIGDDLLEGDAGNDTLNGGAGADILRGGAGTNVATYANALAGVGLSLVTGGTEGEAAGDQFDSIQTVIGSNFSDTIEGGAGAELLQGGLGDDVLSGGLGSDTIAGGAGIDTADYSAATSAVGVVLTAAGNGSGTGFAAGDTLSGIENLTGSAFDDTLTGDGGNNVIDGGSGADSLVGGAGADILIGGTGPLDGLDDNSADTLAGGLGDDIYLVGAGDLVNEAASEGIDTVRTAVPVYTLDANVENLVYTDNGTNGNLTGNALNNAITGSNASNVIDGAEGADTLIGGVASDTLIGGLGADSLVGGLGTDLASYNLAASGVVASLANPSANTGEAQGDVYVGIEDLGGSAGNDELSGDANANTLFGNEGNDTLFGGAGADTLLGEGGDDLFIAGGDRAGLVGNADTYNGGGGIDTVTYFNASSAVTVDLVSNANAGAAENDAIQDIDNVIGSNFGDTLLGDANNNVLTGLSGNDSIDGGDGADLLDGGAGNDTLLGGEGNDTLIGGAGADLLDGGLGASNTLSYATARNAVAFSLAAGAGTLGDAAGDVLVSSSFRFVIGSSFNDTIVGNALDGQIDGGSGNDSISGGDGQDTLLGGSGADVLAGEEGHDSLNGGIGNDTLLGGDGQDLLVGGTGADRLVGGAAADTLTGGADADRFVFDWLPGNAFAFDTVNDFTASQGDKLAIVGSVFTGLSAGAGGALSASSFVTGTAATTGSAQLIYDGGTGDLFYDADGTGMTAAVQIARHANLPALTANDFLLL